MKKKIILLFMAIVISQQLYAAGNLSKLKTNKYINIVQTFADTLLSVATDHYGPINTSMWASVIDLNNMSVPIRGIAPTKGVRESDRALGGSNYYHDVMTMKVMDVLSDITGDDKYTKAVDAYSTDFLKLSQHPETGLLGWGEHLYYHFYRDTVTTSESKLYDIRYTFGFPHEFLAWTPPWYRLWNADAASTQKAIEGVMWHFQGPDTKTYLFNRHASWNKAQYQNVVMPWIKHTVLFSYSFAYLYQKTGDELWKKRAQEIALLYWNNRDYTTNLVFNCFYHATEQDAGKLPDIGSTGMYAYWMYKTAVELDDDKMKGIAKTLMTSYDKYGFNESENYYYNELNLDGTPPEGAHQANAWKIGYGSSSLFAYGRAATYLASQNEGDEFLEIAIKCEKEVPGSPLPDNFTAFNLGEAIGFYMDLYDLTKDKYYQTEAKKYADMGIEHMYKKGLFARETDDDVYEAKLGTGDLVLGILRLGMAESGMKKEFAKFDFSY